MNATSPATAKKNASSHETEKDPSPTPQWTRIDHLEKMPPFLVSLSSEDNHWMFVSSNGGLTAGRESPAKSLFPYQTEDKLTQLAHCNGPVTVVRWRGEDGSHGFWRALDPHRPEGERSLHKTLDNTRLHFREFLPGKDWTFSATWGFSRRFGFIRKATFCNDSSTTAEVEILDGLQGVSPAGLTEAFQNQFSILAHAYTRAECMPEERLRMVYLNSAPTDRAEPSESLRANLVWSSGPRPEARLLTERNATTFLAGEMPREEPESRGVRVCPAEVLKLSVPPGKEISWFWVAEVDAGTAAASDLLAFLRDTPEAGIAPLLEEEWENNARKLRAMIASADGLQLSGDFRRNARHFSNALFNCKRGGVFHLGYKVPVEAYREHLHSFNAEVARRREDWLRELPSELSRPALMEKAAESGDEELFRLTLEFLPLTFSRRHGDPSRPWNKFSIRVRDRKGNRILGYQGNWRDIFQNWEALSYSFPEYTEGFIARFLNSSTADGYNPYRLTHDGFEWEKLDPSEPWSNIGYWGDHQIIYLLRLLEGSLACNDGRLNALLQRETFAFARVPYRIKPFAEVLRDPRQSIVFDDAAEEEIEERVKQIGTDGKMLTDPGGRLLHVSMAEKLLVPLLAKLGNYVPEGGIWMNTQRPEWNDANNALAGYGLSVVTMAYCYRYLGFLDDWWSHLGDLDGFPLSEEVAGLLEKQARVFARTPSSPLPAECLYFLRDLSEASDEYRQGLYETGLSGRKRTLPLADILAFLKNARAHLGRSLAANRRTDGLFHSYNLLHIEKDGLEVSPLQEMLEGQVAILSAGFLSPQEAVRLLDALRQSRLYRSDQRSYLLYPDRDLPAFLEKNKVPGEEVERSALLRKLAEDPDQVILERDRAGQWHFGPDFRNAADLKEALERLPHSYAALVESEGEAVLKLFEDIFGHHAFTGRSGTFFAYEGLGSIYWHMVSKLLLAVQECAVAARRQGTGEPTQSSLENHYREILEGLGIHKTPAEYGAFPTDAYSHTPKHAGAQQPGMTGQVKEDLLIRLGELGVRPEDGCLRFDPFLLADGEFLTKPAVFAYVDRDGEDKELEVPAQSVAFTLCQLPVVYTKGENAAVEVHRKDREPEIIDGHELPPELTRSVFGRDPQLHHLKVTI